mmetsp:Transcript_8320/g.30720  ORF Transcript_8320/g.30720 Transcript_8320/m.30720 type:complete len:745 (-) Transcript_8320:242-2476(-)
MFLGSKQSVYSNKKGFKSLQSLKEELLASCVKQNVPESKKNEKTGKESENSGKDSSSSGASALQPAAMDTSSTASPPPPSDDNATSITTPINLTPEYLATRSPTPLPSLDKLVISKLTIISLGALSPLQALARLELPNNNLTDVYKLALGTLPVLIYLNLSHNKLTSFKGIADCQKLQVLNLSHNEIGEAAADHPLQTQSLKALIMNHNQLTTLPKCKHTQPDCNTLNVSHNRIATLEGLKVFRHVKKLVLSYNEIQSIATGSLKHFKQLDFLDLSHNKLQSAESSAWKHITQLKKLKLSFNNLSLMEDVYQMKKLNQLTELWMFENPVAQDVHDWKKFFPQLVRLDDLFVDPEEQQKYEDKMERRKRMQEWRAKRSGKRKRDDGADDELSAVRHKNERRKRPKKNVIEKNDTDEANMVDEDLYEVQGESKNAVEIFDRGNVKLPGSGKPDTTAATRKPVHLRKKKKKHIDKEAPRAHLSELTKKNDWEHKQKWRSLSKAIPTLKSETQVRKERMKKRKQKQREDFGGLFLEENAKKTKNGDRAVNDRATRTDRENMGPRRVNKAEQTARNNRGDTHPRTSPQRGGSRGKRDGRASTRGGRNNHSARGTNKMDSKFGEKQRHQDNSQTKTTKTQSQTQPASQQKSKGFVDKSHDWDKLFQEASTSGSKFESVKGTERKPTDAGSSTLSGSDDRAKQSEGGAQRDSQYSGVVQKRSASLHKMERIKKKQSNLQDVLMKIVDEDGW